MNWGLAAIGATLTSGYLFVLWQLVGDNAWYRLSSLQLNEIGDALAGAFGPLAILWLILGFFQQGMELRQNNKALQLQAEELKNSVEQQRELVAVTREQVSADLAFMREERDRRWASLEPVFAFRDMFGHILNAGPEFYFQCDIKNAGSKITELSIRLDSNHYRISQDSFPAIIHGESFRLGLTLDRIENFFGFTVYFQYRDADGGHRVQSFVMAPLASEPGRSPGLRRCD